MFVETIFEDAKEVLGFCSESKVFSRLTDAIEALSNKGQWDSLLTYLTIDTTGDNDIITLPPEVDSVLRLNINGSPSYARDRMWEFTLDGPGTNDARIGFQWEDQGDLPQGGIIHVDNNTFETSEGIQQSEAVRPPPPPGGRPPSPPRILPSGGYGLTFPKRISIDVRQTPRGQTPHVIYTINGTDPTWTNGTHGGRAVRLTLNGETTVKAVAAIDARHISEISEEFYTDAPPPPPGPPPPLSPIQRVLRISPRAVSVRALVRLRPKNITSQGDWIPLDSKLAILLMLKAIESYKKATPDSFQLGQAQEKQALQFLVEEQKSRNVASELSKAFDNPPLVGFEYHASNLVMVADIYDEASSICGGIGKQHVLDRISEAVEALANKGQWDSMTAYMDMVPSSDIIGLPRQVEIPIRINMERLPALPRSRMFEFSANGPGTDLSEVNMLTWEDQGDGALLVPLASPSPVSVSGTDAGALVTVYGLDINGKEQSHSYPIPANESMSVSAPITWKTITRISKPVTQGPVAIFGNFSLISFLYPDQTESSFRIIKLNKKADNIKVMFRKSSLAISSTTDLIPLKSRSAILLMLRALQIYKNPQLAPDQVALAGQLEAQALKFMQEEEQSKLAYIQASAKDVMSAFGISTNSKNIVTVAEIYDDASDIFGAVGRTSIFDKITESMEMLANKSQWDGLDGYVDIITDQRGYMTLPRKVEVPIGINFWRTPAQMRSKWYEFHMNGLGTDPVQGYYWDDLGESPIAIEPTQAVRLFATTNQSTDTDVVIRVYGYGVAGQWIRSIENGVFVDGELVPVNFIPPASLSTQTFNTTNHEFAQITRATKDMSDMPITLFAAASVMLPITSLGTSDVTPPNPQFLSQWDADETEPMYRRIRIPPWVKWVRMRFRTSVFKVTKLTDVINLRSKTAIITMMRALKALEGGQLDVAKGYEQTAVQLANEEQQSRNPAETFTLQYDQKTSWADPLQGQY